MSNSKVLGIDVPALFDLVWRIEKGSRECKSVNIEVNLLINSEEIKRLSLAVEIGWFSNLVLFVPQGFKQSFFTEFSLRNTSVCEYLYYMNLHGLLDRLGLTEKDLCYYAPESYRYRGGDHDWLDRACLMDKSLLPYTPGAYSEYEAKDYIPQDGLTLAHLRRSKVNIFVSDKSHHLRIAREAKIEKVYSRTWAAECTEVPSWNEILEEILPPITHTRK
jgi:hypothetical protein